MFKTCLTVLTILGQIKNYFIDTFWSQGECNADNNETAFYACAFGPFMDSWRQEFRTPAHFNGPNAFFGFELLPAYIQDGPFSPASLHIS